MSAHAAIERRRENRRLLLLIALLALAAMGGAAGATTLALFTDQETVTATLGSGSVILDDVRIDALTLTSTAMMPGDQVTDDVVVENDGTAQLRYAMTTSSTDPDGNALRDALTLTVKTIDVNTPLTPCDNFDGALTLYSGVLGASTARFGNPAVGPHLGDRTLDAGANETLCFRVELPSTAGNSYQSATTTTTFTFDAEQTANNP